MVSGWTSVQFCFSSSLSSKVVICGHCLCDFAPDNVWNIIIAHTETHLSAESFWWWQCSVRYSLPLFPLLGSWHQSASLWRQLGVNSTNLLNQQTNQQKNQSLPILPSRTCRTNSLTKTIFILYISTNSTIHAMYTYNNDNVHSSCIHQRPERSHDTY